MDGTLAPRVQLSGLIIRSRSPLGVLTHTDGLGDA